MSGADTQQSTMFSYLSPERRVPAGHPLRRIRTIVDRVLSRLCASFEQMYAATGRPSIAPEKLLRALLLQILYSVRSERLLMEQLAYNLLFRWFVGMNLDEEVWVPTVFSKNRDRLLEGKIAEAFFDQVLAQADKHGLLSDEHFTVDGTLIEAWANRRSFHEKKEPPERGSGYGGKKLLRDTHESGTDPEARLYKKSTAGEAQPRYLGHFGTENPHGVVMKSCVRLSGTREERAAALAMLTRLVTERQAKRKPGEEFGAVTVGGDKGYQEEKFIQGLRELQVVPHIAEYETNAQWPNWLTASEREHSGFAISQAKRKLIEARFGWIKFVAGLRKTKFRGRRRVDWMFTWAAGASNL